MTETDEPARDPARHLLVYRDYRRRPDGTTAVSPITLDDHAAEIERGLAGVREHYDNDWQDGRLAISSTRALAMAVMLRELAIRLRPGTGTGSIGAGAGFSRVAADLADHLHNQRTRSADGYT